MRAEVWGSCRPFLPPTVSAFGRPLPLSPIEARLDTKGNLILAGRSVDNRNGQVWPARSPARPPSIPSAESRANPSFFAAACESSSLILLGPSPPKNTFIRR
jgi:hypothetical protein